MLCCCTKNNWFKVYCSLHLKNNFFILFTFIFLNLKIRCENYKWINNLLCNFYTNTFIKKTYLNKNYIYILIKNARIINPALHEFFFFVGF